MPSFFSILTKLKIKIRAYLRGIVRKFFLFKEKIHYRDRAKKYKEGTRKTICHR